MAVNIEYNETSKEVRVVVTDKFDLSLHKAFGEVINSAKTRGSCKYIIDMGGVNYMDSSALGMLLLLRDSVGRDSSNIDIVKCQASVKDIFSIANFSKLFNIS